MDEAKLDYLAGMKYKDIAEKYNVALSTIKYWKTRNGWQRTKKLKKVCVQKSKKLHDLEAPIYSKNWLTMISSMLAV
ncbi:phage terminase small subunit-related protein [Ligilactobacillus murinus]|uniref:phage terminase small subunit-related protein n=1 Tax=Ligilactobacillus murinus TaxID=1622 RepID=UPI003B839F61